MAFAWPMDKPKPKATPLELLLALVFRLLASRNENIDTSRRLCRLAHKSDLMTHSIESVMKYQSLVLPSFQLLSNSHKSSSTNLLHDQDDNEAPPEDLN